MSTIDISKTHLPERLIEIRRAAGLSQQELADKTGLALRTISAIESVIEKGNPKRVKEKTLLLISDALDVTIEELLNGPPSALTRAKKIWPLKITALRIIISLLIISSSLIVYRYLSYLSVSRARLVFNGGSLEVYDGVFGYLRCTVKHSSNISAHRRIMWHGKQAIIYGLDAKASDGGLLLVRDIRSCKKLWEAEPSPPELDCIFAKDILGTCGFGVRGIWFTDFYGDGEPELVVSYIHGKYYPYFISIWDSDGNRIGTYYHFGHFNDIHPDDIDGDGRQELLVAGTTNMREYEGATILMLDDSLGEGASVDSLVESSCDLRDIAVTRVIFPNFYDKYMSLLGVERLRATNIITSFQQDRAPTITIGIGQESSEVIVTLDNQLRPLSCSISDDLSILINKLPPSERPTERYFNEWLSKSVRFERGLVKLD